MPGPKDVLDLLQQLVVLAQLQSDVNQQTFVILTQLHGGDVSPKEFAHKGPSSERERQRREG